MHSHIGSQIFDAEGFEVAARRTLRLHADFAAAYGLELPELDLGGGFGIAYTSQDTPATPAHLAAALNRIVRTECAALGIAVPQLSIEPGRAISGPAGFALYTVGTVKRVQLDGGASRLYVAVDGGMSDNIRTALYAAEYSATLASRRSDAPPDAGPRGRQALRGRRHPRPRRVPARRRRARRPDRRARPPARTAGAWRATTTTSRARRWSPSATARSRTLVRRETLDDLLALDVG